ncbi:hypothetical protein AB6D11_00165 [Vibrio splendidus]
MLDTLKRVLINICWVGLVISIILGTYIYIILPDDPLRTSRTHGYAPSGNTAANTLRGGSVMPIATRSLTRAIYPNVTARTLTEYYVKHPKYGWLLFNIAHLDQNGLMPTKDETRPWFSTLWLRSQGLRYQNFNIKFQRPIQPRLVFQTHIDPVTSPGLAQLSIDTPVYAPNQSFGITNTVVQAPLFEPKISHRDGKSSLKHRDWRELHFSRANPLPPFGPTIDIFGDESILAIQSPLKGHVMYLINDARKPILIVGNITPNILALTKGQYYSFLPGLNSDQAPQAALNLAKQILRFQIQLPHSITLY